VRQRQELLETAIFLAKKSKLSLPGDARCGGIYENHKGRAFLPPEGDSWE